MEGLVVVPRNFLPERVNGPLLLPWRSGYAHSPHFTHTQLLILPNFIITAAEVRTDMCIFRLDGECDNNLAPFCTAGTFLFLSSIHAEAAPRGEMDETSGWIAMWHPHGEDLIGSRTHAVGCHKYGQAPPGRPHTHESRITFHSFIYVLYRHRLLRL
jgi:hypothetical protein